MTDLTKEEKLDINVQCSASGRPAPEEESTLFEQENRPMQDHNEPPFSIMIHGGESIFDQADLDEIAELSKQCGIHYQHRKNTPEGERVYAYQYPKDELENSLINVSHRTHQTMLNRLLNWLDRLLGRG